MNVRDGFFVGSATIVFEDRVLSNAHCQIDFSELSIDCFHDEINLRNILEVFEQGAQIKNLSISSPLGTLHLEDSTRCRVVKAHPGILRSNNSNLLQCFAHTDSLPKFTLKSSSGLKFSTEESFCEILFSGGAGLAGPANVKQANSIVSSDDFTSVNEPNTIETRVWATALGIACGRPILPILRAEGGVLEFYRGLKPEKMRNRPLYRCQEKYIDINLLHSGFERLLSSALEYLQNLEQAKQKKAVGAFDTYLHARSATGFAPLQLLGAFTFLEWFDDSNTLTPDSIKSSLNIEKDEAKCLWQLRNALTHNRQGLNEPYNIFFREIQKTKNAAQQDIREHGEVAAALNSVFTNTDLAILNLLKADLDVGQYFPTRNGSLRRPVKDVL